MESLKAQNVKLSKQLAAAKKTIQELKSEIRSNKKNWALYLFEVMQTELEKYNLVLNPLPILVEASFNHKSLTYQIKVTDIICVIADKKKKDIYLKSETKNIEGELNKTDIITVNRSNLTMAQFCKDLDSVGYHFVQISRSALVNVAHYHQKNDTLQLLIESKYASAKEFEITKNHIKEYQKKKDQYEYVLSLQRLATRSKEKI